MSVDVKICGIKDRAALDAAVQGGARYVGFVFYPKSPRFIGLEAAAALVASLPEQVISVGLLVDPVDAAVQDLLRHVPLRAVQLHGHETPQRVLAVKQQTGLLTMKACGIATLADVEFACSYQEAADMLLLDAKPTPDATRPGGNASVFDWKLVRHAPWSRPWMLAGGLNVTNLAEAVQQSGARCVDVSSGVEDAVGQKNTAQIHAFLHQASVIETSY